MEDKLFTHFERLRSALTQLSRELERKTDNLWMATWNQPSNQINIEDVLFDLWYLEDQDGRETRIYPGIIALSRQQITFANEVNLAKDAFRKAVQQVKDEDSSLWREIQGKLTKRYSTLNENLNREGLSRLHLKQVFRHIPLLVNRPDKVGFSWYTSGRSIKKISKKDAFELLCKLNTEAAHVKIQLERLANISDSEPLARVQKQAPVLRANMVFPNKSRRSMNVSLPLMFPDEGKIELPQFNVPPLEPPSTRQRLIRSDNKIEDEAYLPSIRVHRYANLQKKNFY